MPTAAPSAPQPPVGQRGHLGATALIEPAPPRGFLHPGRGRLVPFAALIGCAAVLVGWIGYLALTLPTTYVSAHWNIAWIGFDVLLLALLVATAVLGRRRDSRAGMTAFATGVLLVADAWFDWSTSSGTDLASAAATALVVELPLAALLIVASLRRA